MTPGEAAQWIDLFGKIVAGWGPVGVAAGGLFLAWVTARRRVPEPSALERDIAALKDGQTRNVERLTAAIKEAADKAEDATRTVADELHDIRDRVSRIEGKLEK